MDTRGENPIREDSPKFQSYAFISVDFIFVAVALCQGEGEKYGSLVTARKGK